MHLIKTASQIIEKTHIISSWIIKLLPISLWNTDLVHFGQMIFGEGLGEYAM